MEILYLHDAVTSGRLARLDSLPWLVAAKELLHEHCSPRRRWHLCESLPKSKSALFKLSLEATQPHLVCLHYDMGEAPPSLLLAAAATVSQLD